MLLNLERRAGCEIDLDNFYVVQIRNITLNRFVSQFRVPLIYLINIDTHTTPVTGINHG